MPQERIAIGQRLTDVQESWLRARVEDTTLRPVVWLLLSGVLAVAWILQPDKSDSSLTVTALLFLRFVPIFIVAGSIWGRAGTGAAIGMGIFFALTGVGTLSVLLWDGPFSMPRIQLATHASWLSNALYLLGLLGLLACGAATFVLRRHDLALSRRYLQRVLQVLAIVQIALLIELTYTGLWITVDSSPLDLGAATTQATSDTETAPVR